MNDSQLQRIPVQSSVLVSVGYSADSFLDLEFHSGAVYRYFDVPPSIFQALFTADSLGSFFSRNIRNHFRFQRL
jgi:KTSC domain